MAEGIFRKMMVERGMEERVLCQSAGLSAVEGAPVRKTPYWPAGKSAWIYPTTPPRRISGEELSVWDLYFPMSKTHGYILAQAGVPQTKIYIPKYIADPYGAPLEDYRACRDKLVQQLEVFYESYVTRLLVFDNTMPPPPPLPRGQPAPPLTYGKKRESCQKRGFGASFFWARQAETRPALEFCGLAVYNRLVVLLP